MGRKWLRGHDLAVELCRQEKISLGRVKASIEALLLRYSQGQSKGLQWRSTKDIECITKMKQEIRREYIEIISGIKNISDMEYKDFVWKVVASLKIPVAPP